MMRNSVDLPAPFMPSTPIFALQHGQYAEGRV